jgi:6-phosphogluconolactonase
MPRAMYYAGVGPELIGFAVDVENATLERQGSTRLPANTQYAWRHPNQLILYVCSSNGGPRAVGDTHRISAFRIDAATGALTPHGPEQPLKARPLHLCVDGEGKFVLAAYNVPSMVSVHRIAPDGTLGNEVPQSGLDTGIYAHQVLVAPGNRTVIVPARGNDAEEGKPEDPGSLKVFDFADGKLGNKASVAPGGGIGFGPRHLDFHPNLPLVYGSIERQNQLQVFGLTPEGSLTDKPLFTRSTLGKPRQGTGKQLAGAIHVHPTGKFVYVSNRSGSSSLFEQARVADGEDSIAVFALDAKTGEPMAIQHADPQAVHIRNFGIDRTGRLLIASSILPQQMRDGSGVRKVPAGLSVFRIANDGRLTFQRKVDIDTADRSIFWSGIIHLG